MAANSSPAGPLRGVKILDLCSFIAGAYSASMLAEMGADVVKVEPPQGDPSRQWGPFIGGESKFFMGWNRGKRSLAIDATKPEGAGILRRLALKADVLVQNFRPGVAERLGLGYEDLRGENPRLVYVASTAFGPEGPWRLRPAYDPILQSMSGAAMSNMRTMAKVGIAAVPFVDMSTAFLVVTGAVTALYERERTGRGQLVQTSLLQGALACQAHLFCQGLDRPEEGPTGIYPYRLYETSDGQIFIAAPTDKFWRILCEAIGAPELAASPDYKTNTLRTTHADELTEKMQIPLRTKTTAEWERILRERDVPCGQLWGFNEFMACEQVEAQGMSPVIDHPAAGRVRMGGAPLGFSEAPIEIVRPAPRLGEHSVETLREIGCSTEEIEALVAKGTVVSRQ